MDSLHYLGITHANTPLHVRERASVSVGDLPPLLHSLGDLAEQRLILSTCERFEIYAYSNRGCAADWHQRLSAWFGLPCGTVANYVQTKCGAAAAEHLLRVGAGLESRIVGEPQVIGQLRTAYQRAVQCGSVGMMLHALSRSAIRTGKRVRHEAGLYHPGRSIVSITLAHAQRQVGLLAGRTAGIVGTGRLAEEVAAALWQRRANRIVVVSRDTSRARVLGERFGGEGIGIERLPSLLCDCDLLITCTTSPTAVVWLRTVRLLAGKRLCIVDLGVPRNVEPAVGTVPGVHLVHLDELVATTDRNERSIEAGRIVADELERLLRWARERRVAPLIAELLHRWEADERLNDRGAGQALHQRIMGLKAGVAA